MTYPSDPHDGARASVSGDWRLGSAYRRFWAEVGEHFPDLGGAVSTRYYGENERRGFTVVAETAILLIPGWLRMLDLACYSWCRPLAAVTWALVWPFAFLDRQLPAVRRHGYCWRRSP